MASVQLGSVLGRIQRLYSGGSAAGLTDAARLRSRESRGIQMDAIAGRGSATGDRWNSGLHEEIARLPEAMRRAVALCDLEGKTHREAAEQLGWPVGTVSRRLAKAMAMLARRLSQRGVALSGGWLPVLLAQDAESAGMPTPLIGSTDLAAGLVAAGRAGTAGAVRAEVAALADAVQWSMTMSKFKLAAAALLTVGVVVAGSVALLHRARADDPRKVDQPVAGDRVQEVPILRKLKHGEQILGVAFSPDGKMLASAGFGAGAKVKLWSTRTGERSQTLEGAWVGWRSVAFSPDGKRLAAVGDGRQPAEHGGGEPFRLWDAATGEPIWTAPTVEPPAEFFAVAFSPDGKLLAGGGRSRASFGGFDAKIGVLRLHDPRTGKLLRSITGLVDVWALAFSPDGKALAAATNSDNLVSLFETTNWALTESIPVGSPTSLAFSPDGRTLAVGSMSVEPAGIVTMLDLAGKAKPRHLAPQPESVLAVALSPDGKLLATGGYDKTARVYDAETGVLKRSRTTIRWANAVAFSPDGTILAIGTSPDALLWNWGTDAGPPGGREPGTEGLPVPGRK